MSKGSLIGNVAQDLGLDIKRLRMGRARIVTGESTQYAELRTDKGILVVSERIDREQLCGDITPCSFSFEIILENPIELHQSVGVAVEQFQQVHKYDKIQLSYDSCTDILALSLLLKET
ncbi:hypothetical protein cypCar_00032994 [Cyprinus carpio]|nr:hypothetical protein cypCar_00032994 [Cyprinus carpio]